MVKKFLLFGLLGFVALFGSACAASSFLGDDEAGDVVADEEFVDGPTEEDSADDPPGNPEGTDDDSSVGAGDLSDIELPEGVTEAEAEAMVATAVSGEVPPEVEDCVTNELFSRPGLFVALVGAGSDAPLTDLAFEDQVTFAEITIECATPELLGTFVADGFAEGADLPPSPEMGTCFAGRFGGSDGPLSVVGMTAIDEGQPVDERAKGPLVDTLSTCVTGAVLADSLVQSLGSDPTFAAAVDTGCLESSYDDDPAFMRPFWTAFVENPDVEFEDLPPTVTSPVFSPLFSCISLGQVLASEAAADGIELSDDTIECIDEEAAELGLFESFLTGEMPDEESLGLVIIGCLTEDELEQLFSA